MGAWVSYLWRGAAGEYDHTDIQKRYILVAGLDGAGKTSFINALTSSYNYTAMPTIGYREAFFLMKKDLDVTLFEVGGDPTIRKLWSTMCELRSDKGKFLGIFFVIDSTQSKERYLEASSELLQLLTYDCLKEKPLCILNNKIDKEGWHSAACSKSLLNIGDTIGGHREFSIVDTCMINQQGIKDAMYWMRDHLP